MPVRRHTIALLTAALLVPGAVARAAQDGTITKVAGTTAGFAGDGGPAAEAKMDTPRDVAFIEGGGFVIADFGNDRVRQVRPDGTIFTAAGSGRGLSGDGGPADEARLDRPRGVTAVPGGGYLIADTFNHRIRRVAPDGTISTVAGSTQGAFGDGGPATMAQLSLPSDTATLPDGGFIVADTGNGRVRRVWPDGSISTVATGFDEPRDVAVASDGAFLVADTGNSRIARIAADGTVTTVAGTTPGLSGDGDPASIARLQTPFSVAALPNGGFLFADTGNHRVRRVTPLGAIIAVAGSTGGLSGDGGPAESAQLSQPGAITLAPGGGFLVADTGNAQIRRVSGLGAIPPAVLGRSFTVAPGAGAVTVRPFGQPGFLPLAEKDIVPITSEVDAAAGRLFVTSALDPSGVQQTAELYEGAFSVRQGSGAAPFTNFRLRPLDCAASTRAVGQRKRKKRRRVWVSEKGGRWRSSTGSTSASAVGTVWSTTLLCEGTRITVVEGTVRVRDKIRKRNRLVRAGESFLVRTGGARRGQ